MLVDLFYEENFGKERHRLASFALQPLKVSSGPAWEDEGLFCDVVTQQLGQITRVFPSVCIKVDVVYRVLCVLL